MSVHDEGSVMTPLPSSPCHATEATSLLDTEMTYPLTPNQNRSRSSSPLRDSEISAMSSFQSSRTRNERMTARQPTEGGFDNRQQLVRAQTTHYNSYSGPEREYNPQSPMMHGAYDRGRSSAGGNAYGHGDGNGYSQSYLASATRPVDDASVPLNIVHCGRLFPSEAQAATAHAYALQRGNGQITRLIPADERISGTANPLIPMFEPATEGLIILPETRQKSPSHRYGPEPMVSRETVAALSNSYRSPAVPDPVQSAIDNIVSRSTSSAPRAFGRREKIYCDKWIHEGICAFTQMGCKYKHEMPSDKATQVSLGLNHGYPSWYRREVAPYLNMATTSPAAVSASSGVISPPGHQSRHLGGNWRRPASGPVEERHPRDNYPAREDRRVRDGRDGRDGSQRDNRDRRAPGAAPQTSFGPIAPPPSSFNSGFASTNPFDKLKEEEDPKPNEHGEDPNFNWRGRGRGGQH